jgi:hypothetical protein
VYSRRRTAEEKTVNLRHVLAVPPTLLLLAACAGGETAATEAAPASGSSSAPATSASTGSSEPVKADELRGAVQGYSDGFLGSEPVEAYDYFSARCKEKVSLSYFTGIVIAAKSTYGSALPITSYDAQVDGDLARVTYTYEVPALNQEAEPWVREGGQWKTDDC